MAPKTALALCAVAFLSAALLTPLIGSTPVSLGRALSGVTPDREIFFSARLPRVLMALIAGAALATGGTLFQALFRDALATPYTLGISSGASLGAVIAIVMGMRETAHLPAVWVFAFAGAAITLVLVLGVATEGSRVSPFTLLLAGVTVNSVCIAMILFLQNLTTVGRSMIITRWLMGGIEPVEYGTLAILATAVAGVCVYIFLRGRDWNLIAVGEEWAAARGVSPGRVMMIGYVSGSFLTAAVTALTGPIGFIGLIVPHALRLKLGADHRILLPCAALLGAAFLAVCDTAARTMLSPSEVPVGVITALLGGPFFIWLLRTRRKSQWR